MQRRIVSLFLSSHQDVMFCITVESCGAQKCLVLSAGYNFPLFRKTPYIILNPSKYDAPEI